jgi:hypothetical protein
MADGQRFSLAPMFAVVGGVGGWLTADAYGCGDEAPRWMLVAVTPLVAYALGLLVSPRVDGWKLWLPKLVGCILLAGTINGLIIGSLIEPLAGSALGMVVGFFWAFPFVPPLVAIVWVRGAARPRPGSIVESSHRRLVWLTTLAFAGVTTALRPRATCGACAETAIFAWIAFGCIAAILALGLWQLARARRVEAQLAAAGLSARTAPEVALASEAARVDFGLGDQYTFAGGKLGSAYRDSASADAAFRGDAARARAFLSREVLWSVALLVALAALLSIAR